MALFLAHPTFKFEFGLKSRREQVRKWLFLPTALLYTNTHAFASSPDNIAYKYGVKP